MAQQRCVRLEIVFKESLQTGCEINKFPFSDSRLLDEGKSISVGGIRLPESCFSKNASACTVELCGNSVQSTVTVESEASVPLLFEMYINENLLEPSSENISCRQRLLALGPMPSSCECGQTQGLISQYHPSQDFNIEEYILQSDDDDDDSDDEDEVDDDVVIIAVATTVTFLIVLICCFCYRRGKQPMELNEVSSGDGTKAPTFGVTSDLENNIAPSSPVFQKDEAEDSKSEVEDPKPNNADNQLISADLLKSASETSRRGASYTPKTFNSSPGQQKKVVSAGSKHRRRKKSKRGKSKLKRRHKVFNENPESKFGLFLRNRLSGSISTKATGSTAIDVKSFKTGITRDEVQSFKKLKSIRVNSYQTEFTAQSVKTAFNSVYTNSHIDELLSRGSVALYSKQKQVIKIVVKKLSAITLDEHDSRDFYSGEEASEISMEDYLYRLMKSLDLWFEDLPSVKAVGMRSLIISLVYLKMIQKNEPNFTLTVFNQHRIFAVMILIAAKFTEDSLIRNKYWASVSGMELDDLNEVEEEFCKTAKFKFWVNADDLNLVYEEYGLLSFLGDTNLTFTPTNLTRAPNDPTFSPMTEVSIDEE